MGNDFEYSQDELGSPMEFGGASGAPPPQAKCAGVSQTCSLISFLVTGCLGITLLIVTIVVFNGAVASATSPDFDYGKDAKDLNVVVGSDNTEQGTATSTPSYYKVMTDTIADPKQTTFRACVTGDVKATARFGQPPGATPSPPPQGQQRNIDVLEATYEIPTCASGKNAKIPVCYGNYSTWVRVSAASSTPFTLQYSIKNCVVLVDTCFTEDGVCAAVLALNFFGIIFSLLGAALLFALTLIAMCITGICFSCCSCCFGCCFTVLFFRNRKIQQGQNFGVIADDQFA